MSAFNYTNSAPLLILAGPTGSGKTAVAIELCEILNGEIVSADSMQIYRGMNIGTAKATREEQTRARHHLLDIVNPDAEYSAAQWARAAKCAINEIRARGKTPIICGGTGFYISALLYPQRLASAPPNPQLRAELQNVVKREGNEGLHARLQTLDENAAARLHRNDVMRVTRAIEVTVYRKQFGLEERQVCEAETEYSFAAFGLNVARAELYRRLDARVDGMLAAGFMDELKTLIEADYGDCAPLQSLGYKQMRAALEDANQSARGLELWKRDTRRYAKRQMTWFAHQLPVRSVDVGNFEVRELAQIIAQAWHATAV